MSDIDRSFDSVLYVDSHGERLIASKHGSECSLRRDFDGLYLHPNFLWREGQAIISEWTLEQYLKDTEARCLGKLAIDA